jgi:hypothetical protein
MSQDVILGSTDRNWSRSPAKTEPNDKSAPLTDLEKDRIEKLAKLEMLATRGDVAAQKKMVEVNAAIATLQSRAQKGDAKSKRILSTLQESGLIVLSESKSGPRLVVAGAAGRTRRPRQKMRATAASPNQQVSEFLLNLKMRAMAGDPQAIAAMQQYQQIITPPEGQQPMPGQPMPMEEGPAEPMLEQPEAPMAGDESSSGYNSHLAFIRGLGEEEIALAREGGACERAALRRRF